LLKWVFGEPELPLVDKKTLDLSDPKKFLLLADLYANSRDLARCAEDGGADAVLLHLNESSSQGARFGGLEIEEDSIKECLTEARVPFGLTIGDARLLTIDEWERCIGLGFAFVNMFAHHMPLFVLKDDRIAKILSIGPGYLLEQIKAMSEFKELSALITSITSAQGYGGNLNVLDVTTVKLIVALSKRPILFPTQRLVRFEDVPILKNLGAKGIVLTSVAYGNSADSLKESLAGFRQAILAPTGKK
jgi:hypothetical protein